MGFARIAFTGARRWWRRWCYREGRRISRFVAMDVRRDVVVVDASEVDDGYLVVRVRTSNLLYELSGLVEPAEYGVEERVAIDQLWKWSGKSWGGLADGTSLAERKLEDESEA